MKTLNILLILTLTTFTLLAQRQLDIQGDPSSSDTVATIRVNSTAFEHVIGLSVYSHPQPDWGIGGYFYGGAVGISGASTNYFGVHGISTYGFGVYGYSDSGIGIHGFSDYGDGVVGSSLSGTGGHFDGEVSGVYGESESGFGVKGESESNWGVYGASTSGYGVRGESSSSVGIYGFSEFESGVVGYSEYNWGLYGNSQFGTGGRFWGGGGVAIELEGWWSEWGDDSDDCVLRSDADKAGSDLIMVSNDVISFHLDEDDGDTNSSMWVFNGHDNINPIFHLDESGNLTLSGTCSCSSDVNRKEKFSQVDSKKILERVATLPISEWQFKGENTRHVGPMAQDFYAAFGLGANETTIATVDTDGVALAAIQALKAENDALKQRLEQLEARVARLE